MSNLSKLAVHLETARIPNSLRWYDVAGQTIFPVYGQSGGLAARYVSYLGGKRWPDGDDMGIKGLKIINNVKVFAVELHPDDTEETVHRKVAEAVEAMNGN